jgi:hypothetical protein
MSSWPVSALFTAEDSVAFTDFMESYPALGPHRSWVLSTPNSLSFLPRPPPPIRRLVLCEDGYFGANDPVHWPQPTIKDFEYLACIRTSEFDEASRFWRRGPSITDTTPVPRFPGSLQLSPSFLTLLRAFHAQVTNQLIGFRAKVSPPVFVKLEGLIERMNDAYLAVCNCRETFAALCLRWGTLGRCMLEVQAYIDYHRDFKPRQRRIFDGVRLAEPHRMGAFTTTPDITKEFFEMRIPVWQIRPANSVYLWESRMLHRVPPRDPDHLTSAPSKRHEVFWIGDCWSDGYMSILQEWHRHAPVTGKRAMPAIGLKRKLADDESTQRKTRRSDAHIPPRRGRCCFSLIKIKPLTKVLRRKHPSIYNNRRRVSSDFGGINNSRRTPAALPPRHPSGLGESTC